MSKITDAVSEMVVTFGISFILFIIVYVFLAFPEVVVGSSMEPTLYTNDRLIVERITARFNKLERGDIVILNPPGNGNIDYVKRIVGLPAERIEIVDCKIYIWKQNQEKMLLKESYISSSVCTKDNERFPKRIIEVPKDSYFVLGDNRDHSADSRYFGTLTKDRIDGKVMLRFWPLNKARLFN